MGEIGCPGYLTDSITQLRLLFPPLSHMTFKAGVRSVLGEAPEAVQEIAKPQSVAGIAGSRSSDSLALSDKKMINTAPYALHFHHSVLPGGSTQPAPGKCTHVHISS